MKLQSLITATVPIDKNEIILFLLLKRSLTHLLHTDMTSDSKQVYTYTLCVYDLTNHLFVFYRTKRVRFSILHNRFD